VEEEIKQVVGEHRDGFEDVLCGYLCKINQEQCPKDVSDCSSCLKEIIETLNSGLKE
jgi:hypothetical protein